VNSIVKKAGLTILSGVVAAGAASASEVLVTGTIATSTTWTKDNTYNLQGQVYVASGATLTIEAGTIVASDPGGSIAITRGAQIMAMGTRCEPIIFTSKADQATWTNGNPKTGVWREAANEWGNITVMGRAFISEDAIGTNLPTCDPSNVGDMEGLTNGPSTDRYGGGDDNDDSGVLSYVSLRYGGKVVALTNELNGLSMGGIGRGTDVHHIDIMNNVDDGVETWGGTVNYKYINVWNIGDDSFDIDQGWRGKAQFICIVQGYSTRSGQGSGTGDNCFETDGAEQSDYQPVTTATIYNATVIGQPVSGDHATAWRDNARVQYRNCIFMDIGDRLVSPDNIDGDGGAGYGFGGTLSWAATWTTDYNAVPAHANDCPAGTYQAQTSGKLAEIKDSVFYNVANYTEAGLRGVVPGNGTNNNVQEPGASPIRMIVRGPNVSYSGLTMQPVIKLDPRPINSGLTNVGVAPNDGFFTQANYRGAFAPNSNWLTGWTAADAFGFIKRDKVDPCAPAVGGPVQKNL
jgi:hypothetical protein